ncbi:sodium-dependent transporter [Alteromonas sp. MB-3u-76]|jgi:NSS family neurotransmitter:Na+ symporter|uniref:sodium-dependent transporter n=1 Tax=unclassified Alteromonas TaxID=2614992 RepID=UPI0009037FEC|nr:MULTISPECIES: sodium-dependent transporter [unclassified Alteromonas]APE05157.1 sodium-dependent transporter [Alteromonas sp. RW2A1]AUC88201.1 sodium-dependent transporter [Alteromonas sp. MB-3u-76]
MAIRGEFSSRIGFVLAAAGSAVGLGNIWGFPTKVASNGGAAFVLVYLLLAFVLAYPVLMAELIIGRSSRSNMVDALGKISGNFVGRATGIWGCVTVSLILAFYAIVGGWMLVYFADSAVRLVGMQSASDWLLTSSVTRNVIFCALFMMLTAFIVVGGVKSGIEKWSVRLMPTLVILILALIVYVSMQPGAVEGWSAYLVPDFSRVLDPELLINAMGQAFFSMSLGVGTMLVYGSYLSKNENLPTIGASVALVDIGVAVIAGMLIIPAMYVALNNGVEIFTDHGALIQGDTLIFKVLPALFDTIGSVGIFVSFTFFALMAIAAVTSSISMLEVPVAFMVESKGMKRHKAVIFIAAVIFILSCIVIFNFELLFGFVIALTTEYSQPLLGLALCIFAGWVWRRDAILAELKQGNENVEHGLFWKIWPWYVRFVCPVIIALMFYRSVF